MRRKAYIICIAKGGVLDKFDYKQFHDTLTTAKGVIDWWHYLETTYIIITEQYVMASNVGQFVRQIAPQKELFVCELNLSNHDGWLTKEAWDWINKYY